jgi:hypothetical protein
MLSKDLKDILFEFNAHNVEYLPAHIISKDHLIQNKLAVGRLQDLADVEKIRDAAEVRDGATRARSVKAKYSL